MVLGICFSLKEYYDYVVGFYVSEFDLSVHRLLTSSSAVVVVVMCCCCRRCSDIHLPQPKSTEMLANTYVTPSRHIQRSSFYLLPAKKLINLSRQIKKIFGALAADGRTVVG
jgi:hypothetical protein